MIAGQAITIPSGNTVTVVGNRQLILLSTGSITISGTLDAAGHGRTSGPAGDVGPCGAGAKNPTTGTPSGGGGGHGTFEGANVNSGRNGGESTAPDSAGSGGQGGAVTGGDGGNGGFGTTGSLPGENGANGNQQAGQDGAGGGGGGGGGIIKVYADEQSGTDDLSKVAPPPSAS